MYTLYFSPGSASMCVHMALLEIGVEHTLVPVDFTAGDQRSPEFLKLNPFGKVPILLIDGVPAFESGALLMVLADRHPAAGLAPSIGSAQRTRWYQWIVHMSNRLQPAFRHWFYPGDIGGGDNVRVAVVDAVRAVVESEWDQLDRELRDHGPYILGERFSAADIMLLMLMRWSRNMPKPATQWPHLAQFAARAKARSSWKTMCEREGLAEWA